VEILFDLYEKGPAAHDYPPSCILNVDESGLTVVPKKQQKNTRTQRQTSNWRFNCGIKGFLVTIVV
jgi:hypothetical protein